MPTPQTDTRLASAVVSVPLTEIDIGEEFSDAVWLRHRLVARGNFTS